MPVSTDSVHLHRDDCPETLKLLDGLLGHKAGDLRAIGYEPTDVGAWVDWDRLANSYLSTTERAVLRIALGCSALERRGGAPPRVARLLVDVVGAVAG